jgi:hypothetical protein
MFCSVSKVNDNLIKITLLTPNTVHQAKTIFHDFIFKVGTDRKIVIQERFLFCIRINNTNLVDISG